MDLETKWKNWARNISQKTIDMTNKEAIDQLFEEFLIGEINGDYDYYLSARPLELIIGD